MIPPKLKNWFFFPVVLLGGIAVGILMPFDQIRNTIAAVFDLAEESVKEADEPHDDMHVEITETAQKSLGLSVRRAQLSSYQSTYDIPATIRPLPGAEAIHLSSRFEGLVRRVFISQGMSVRVGDPLFEIELTGEKLSRLQSDLLLAVRKNENLTEEIKRLEPLIQQGGLANKRSLELRYQQKQLLAEVDTRKQELLLMGLSDRHLQAILEDKQLVRKIVVCVPEHLLPPQINLDLESDNPLDRTFVVESFSAQAGSMVNSRDELCVMAFHEILVVEGHAFEKDLEVLKDLMDHSKGVAIGLGSSSNPHRIPDCHLAFIGNHAQGATNTYPFFVYLKNELGTGSAGDGPQYLSWRWKPGQLGHVELPRQSFDDMIVLPREAVAEDGVSRFVFEWKGQVEHDHDEDHEHGDNEEHDHEHADEFVPVEVNVVFMNQEIAVVDPGGKLKVGTRIAYNNAAQLLFSMQSGGGHGHAHGHSHGHEH